LQFNCQSAPNKAQLRQLYIRPRHHLAGAPESFLRQRWPVSESHRSRALRKMMVLWRSRQNNWSSRPF